MERGEGSQSIPRTSSDASTRRRMNNGTLDVEEELHLPLKNVTKIMRRILPPHAKISDESKETIQKYVSQFIALVTAEANNCCKSQQRRIITAEDILSAMANLDFQHYRQPLAAYLDRYRAHQNTLHGDPFVTPTVDNPPAENQGQIVFDPPAAAMNDFIGNPQGAHASISSALADDSDNFEQYRFTNQ